MHNRRSRVYTWNSCWTKKRN